MDRRRSWQPPRSGNYLADTPRLLKACCRGGQCDPVRNGGRQRVVVHDLGKFKVDGTIDAQNHVTRVATKVPNPVMGDTDVVATYSDYKDFSGVQFPTKILIEQGGFLSGI